MQGMDRSGRQRKQGPVRTSRSRRAFLAALSSGRYLSSSLNTVSARFLSAAFVKRFSAGGTCVGNGRARRSAPLPAGRACCALHSMLCMHATLPHPATGPPHPCMGSSRTCMHHNLQPPPGQQPGFTVPDLGQLGSALAGIGGCTELRTGAP